MRAFPLAALLFSVPTFAAPPRPVVELAAAIDGAVRSDGKKECTFKVEKPDCALPVRVSCATPLFKYSYVMTLPLGKLDPRRCAYQLNAGGFPGSHGVELTASAELIVTVTDEGQKTNGDIAVLAFGASPDDEKRAKKLLASLAAARSACR